VGYHDQGFTTCQGPLQEGARQFEWHDQGLPSLRGVLSLKGHLKDGVQTV
jgi:hypothetical protein